MNDNNVDINIRAKVEGIDESTAKVEHGLDSLRGAAASVSDSMAEMTSAQRYAAVGLASVTTVAAAGLVVWGGYQALQVAAAMSIKDTADEVGKLAQRMGQSAEQVSAWRYAGALSNVGMQEMATATKALSDRMQEADRGTGRASEAFKAMGISTRDAAGHMKSTDQMLQEIAEKFAGYKDGAEKTALANDLLGRSGERLIPLLNQGAAGLASAADEARRFGVVYGEDLAKRSEQLNDNLTRLNMAAEGMKVAFGTEMVGALADVTAGMVEATKQGGLLYGVISGLGLAGKSLLGGEINPFANAKNLMGEKLKEIAEAEERLQRLERDLAGREDTGAQLRLREARARLELVRNEYIGAVRAVGSLRPDGQAEPTESAPVPPKAERGGKGKSALERMNERGQKNEWAAYYSTAGEETMREVAEKRAIESARAVAREVAKAESASQRLIAMTASGKLSALAEQQDLAAKLLAEDRVTFEGYDEIMNQLGGVKDKGKDTFDELTRAVDGWGKSASKSFVDFAFTGKTSFSDLMGHIAREAAAMAVYEGTFKPAFSAIGEGIKGMNIGKWFANADGGVYSSGDLHRYANTVVSSPTLFRFAQGGAFGLMGEAGEEAIMPLSRDSSGRLGVRAQGGAGTGSGISSIRVEIANQGTPQRVVSAQPSFDVKGMVVRIVTADLRDNGPIRQAMSGMR